MKSNGISVLLPVRNGQTWLREALASILSQSLPADQVVIVDDGSTDSSISIIREFWHSSFHLVTGSEKGLAEALKLGLEECKFEFVARMDQDDICHPQRLKQQRLVLSNQPQVVLCGSYAKVIGERGRLRRIKPPTDSNGIRLLLSLYNPMVHSSVMFRKSAVLSVGSYASPTDVPYPEDYDLWLRLKDVGCFLNLPLPLVHYRKHNSNASRLHARKYAEASFELAHNATLGALGTDELLPGFERALSWLHGIESSTSASTLPSVSDLNALLASLVIATFKDPKNKQIPNRQLRHVKWRLLGEHLNIFN